MKHILIVDLEDDSKCGGCPYSHAWYCRSTNYKTYGIRTPSECPLRPMPQKKEVEVNEIEDLMHTEYSIEDITNKYIATIQLATDKLISLGWNACLKEIEK